MYPPAPPRPTRYALFNVAEALAAGSGAFYVNDTERAVYYAPLPGEDMAALEVRWRMGGEGVLSEVRRCETRQRL